MALIAANGIILFKIADWWAMRPSPMPPAELAGGATIALLGLAVSYLSLVMGKPDTDFLDLAAMFLTGGVMSFWVLDLIRAAFF